MTDLPLISVVVPSFNQGKFLEETLDSIFRQVYPRLEVVVIDGGSTDGSVEVIRRFAPQLAYWQSEPDNGQTSAINIGAARCSGDMLTWLNSDDFYWKDALWTVAKAFQRNPGYGLYIGNGLRYSQSEDRYRPFCERHVALRRDALVEGLDYILQPATFFLRDAWKAVGGLDEKLHYCMDWDVIIRIAQRYPAVLINEFLAVSREYAETKTGSGGMRRAMEILEIARTHCAAETTPGALFYFCETLLGMGGASAADAIRPHVYEMMQAIANHFRLSYGNPDGFPQTSDAQDADYLPFAATRNFHRPINAAPVELPAISVVTPSYNQAEFLTQTLESLRRQAYPALDIVVIDGGSTDNSVEVIKSYEQHLAYWVSEPDRGPSHAINKGFAQAKGEILAWLNSDDLLADGALHEVAKAFAADPELDMVYANALYIDENNRLFLADHGHCKTGLYYGRIQPRELVPAYWKYVHSVPQPTVFFRRRLLDQCGLLDEKYQFIFDFELFWRFMSVAKIRKIEKTLAFYRIHAKAKTAGWRNFEIELYRFSRPWWPSIGSDQFLQTLRDFTAHYMKRKCPGLARGFRFYAVVAAVALSAASRIGNPEKWLLAAPTANPGTHPPAGMSETPHAETYPNASGSSPDGHGNDDAGAYTQPLSHRRTRYRSFFCSYCFPRHPGYSGGEIRDFHILRHLLGFSQVAFYALYDLGSDHREPLLELFCDRIFTADSSMTPRRRLAGRLASWLRSRNFPVYGLRYHYDAHERFPRILSQVGPALQAALSREKPHFLFVSPQSNPVAMPLDPRWVDTRFVMASYDVERVRLQRLAASQSGLSAAALNAEARRATRFEKDNLRLYDGIIAVSQLDKDTFVSEYGFPDERVLVLDNGIDPAYFRFHARKHAERPEILYTGSFTYPPNRQAAWRLIRGIMPAVWRRLPRARLWIVGQSPGRNLETVADGERIVVTGRVKDVRPYLAGATVGCVPLVSGSGTKYKVLEALSAGVPLVCSPIAAEALELRDGEEILIRNSDSEIADAIVQLLVNPLAAQQMAHRGRSLVETRYSWDAFLPRLDPWLAHLVEAPLWRRTAERDLSLQTPSDLSIGSSLGIEG